MQSLEQMDHWPLKGPTHFAELSNEYYHRSPGVSKSGLAQMLESPAHFYDNYLWPQRERREPSASMLLGTVVHSLILEPEKFNDEYVIAPEINRRTKAGKDQWLEFLEGSQGKMVLDSELAEKAISISEAVFKSPHYDRYIKPGGFAEHSYYWQDKTTGLWCKCRPDFVTHDNIVVDVKTAAETSINGFARACANFHYDMSAAMTLDGMEAVTGTRPRAYVFLIVPTTKPYRPHYVASRVLTGAAQLRGYDLYKRALDDLAFSLEENDWPGYSDDLIEFDLPKWAYYE